MDDREQLAAWYMQHARPVQRALRAQGFSVEVVEDACAEAFTVLTRLGVRHIDQACGPLAWLRTVARHEALRLSGAGRPQPVSLDAEQSSGGGGEGTPVTLADRIPDRRVDVERQVADRNALEAIGYLSRGQQTALVGRLAGFTYDELADRTGHTRTWVNRHTTEGRRALRDRTGR